MPGQPPAPVMLLTLTCQVNCNSYLHLLTLHSASLDAARPRCAVMIVARRYTRNTSGLPVSHTAMIACSAVT